MSRKQDKGVRACTGPLCYCPECFPRRDDAVARAQQVAADVAAQDGLDVEEAGAMEQCMMDMLEQEGLL